jgi:hypothetical protein
MAVLSTTVKLTIDKQPELFSSATNGFVYIESKTDDADLEWSATPTNDS